MLRCLPSTAPGHVVGTARQQQVTAPLAVCVLPWAWGCFVLRSDALGPVVALPVFLSSLPSYRAPALCQALG